MKPISIPMDSSSARPRLLRLGTFAVFGVLAALSLGMSRAAYAHEYQAGHLKIEHPYARATPPAAQVGGGYFTLDNTAGEQADRLISLRSDIADHTELHTHVMDGDVARMRPVSAIEIARGSKVELKPGGFHVMFMGLKRPLKEGDRFPLELNFEKAGKVVVEVHVEGLGATGAAALR